MEPATNAPPEDVLSPHAWGRAPDLYGPRHAYREGLLLRRLRAELPGGRVLNAGCGAGSFTLALLERGYDVVSIDASNMFVEHVRSLLAERGRQAAQVELGDVQNLELPDASFDAVACGEVLEHLDDDLAAVREFKRVLRPGGVVVASVPANPWRYDWCDLWAGHRRRYTEAGLRRRLAAAGFTDVRVVSYGFPLTGLFHRRVYMPMLRRRLEAGDGAPGGGGSAQRRLAPVIRWAL